MLVKYSNRTDKLLSLNVEFKIDFCLQFKTMSPKFIVYLSY